MAFTQTRLLLGHPAPLEQGRALEDPSLCGTALGEDVPAVREEPTLHRTERSRQLVLTVHMRRSFRRIILPYGYTCRLTRNHNNFVLNGLARLHFIELRGDGWARPTELGVFAFNYYEKNGLL